MDSGDAADQARSPWSSPRAITGYVLVAILIVVVSFWAARAGRADAVAGPSPTTSPTSSEGTPRVTITLTPSWESPPEAAASGATQLAVEPAGMTQPVVIGGSVAGGYARLDPAGGSWSWNLTPGLPPLLGWSGSTAVFGADGGTGRPTVLGVAPDGSRDFVNRMGSYVTSTPSRVLLADGRRLTALTATGAVAWRAKLPTGVTVPGRIAGITGPADVPAAPTEVVFVSSSGPARVSAVDLVDGRLRTWRVTAVHPEVWSTAWGVLVADSTAGTVARYDLGGTLAWTRQAEGEVLLAADGNLALVSDGASETVSLLRLQDGTTVWTSDPLEGPVATGSLLGTESGPVLIPLTFTDSDPAVVVAADPTTGEQLWAVERRNLLGTWHGYALFAESDGRALSALDLRTGISYATLNASTVVEPATSVLVGSTLIYLDTGRGTARAVTLSDQP